MYTSPHWRIWALGNGMSRLLTSLFATLLALSILAAKINTAFAHVALLHHREGAKEREKRAECTAAAEARRLDGATR